MHIIETFEPGCQPHHHPISADQALIYEMLLKASAEAMLTIAADPDHLVSASPSRRYAVAVSPISNAYA